MALFLIVIYRTKMSHVGRLTLFPQPKNIASSEMTIIYIKRPGFSNAPGLNGSIARSRHDGQLTIQPLIDPYLSYYFVPKPPCRQLV
jgi:hypothetical protein